MQFIDWDARPAVLTEGWKAAWAVLRPGGDWTPVDAGDVGHTGAVMSEADWRARFGKLPPLPGPPPISE